MKERKFECKAKFHLTLKKKEYKKQEVIDLIKEINLMLYSTGTDIDLKVD